MLNGSNVSLDIESNGIDCAFCKRTEIFHILKETPNFLLVADHAPLVEGHILIIPKQHYACFGDAPAKLDTELLTLKRSPNTMLQWYSGNMASSSKPSSMLICTASPGE